MESFLEQATEDERREFADAVKRGDLELPANLTNVLTGLCHPAELARWTDASRRLKRRYGIETSPVAMHTDIPGLAWPTVDGARAQAGVRYFSSGPNYMPNLKPDGGDRIGSTLVEHGDRPFWWVSPSGRERLLMWVAGRGYSWFHGANLGRTTDAATRGILDYSRELTERGYPYEIVQVRYTVGGDNGPVDPKLPEFVASWNERYETPRLVLDSAQGLFEAFERRYGASLPEKRGDLTPYWEDGAISSAGEEILARAAARRLVQAEALWGIRRSGGVPAGPGRGGVAPGAAVARAHVGSGGEHLGARTAGRRGPVGVQAGLRGRGRPPLAADLRRGRRSRRRIGGPGRLDRQHPRAPPGRPRGPPRRALLRRGARERHP